MVNHSARLGNLTAPIPFEGYDFSIVQYADDTLIILQACPTQILVLKYLLHTFGQATGLSVNYSKLA